MKKIIFILHILLFSFSHAQVTLSPQENYVYEKNCLSEDCSKKSESVQYFDGLGRVKQTITIKSTPTGKDNVVPATVYDAYGRPVKSYLPIPQAGTQNGSLFNDPLSNASVIYGSEKIYTEKILEASPLGRIQQHKQVGNVWSSHPVQLAYLLNTSADVVRNYVILSTTWQEGRTNSTLSISGVYAANTLYKSVVTDEDGNTETLFKNKKGQTILVRKKDGTQNVDTYYVYDYYGQLAYTVPPAAAALASVADTTLDNFCYQYRYDGWKRLVEKKVPGKGWEFMVYDKQDRLVLAQDANLRTTTNNFAAKGWMFTKYDQFGRVAYTGFFSNTGTRAAMQNALNNMNANAGNNEARSSLSFSLNGMDIYYTKNAFPTGSMKVLSVNYYDTYPSYPFNPSFPSSIMGKSILSDNSTANAVSTKSLPVMSLVKNIEDDNWTKNYVWYDVKGRIIGTHSINHLGGFTNTESNLDFTGVPQNTYVFQARKADEPGVTIRQRYIYDSKNRLLQHYHQVDSKPEELLSENTYNELSQITNKKVGNNLQSIDYDYNIRGWITEINKNQMNLDDLGGKLFSYKIKYDQKKGITNPDPALFAEKNVVSKYNGSIAEIDWRSVETVGVNPASVPKRYGYTYDSLNRMTAGFYQNPQNPYSKENTESLTYDLNGNINSMYRTSVMEYGNSTPTVIDNLSYAYTGNRINTVNDSSQNFAGYEGGGNTVAYDSNGNITSMQDKGISLIKYNYLNLPNYLNVNKFGNEDVTIKTGYRADGTKLRKENTTIISGFNGNTTTVNVTDYLDGFQYFSSKSVTPPPSGSFEMMSKRAMQPQAFSIDEAQTASLTAKTSDLQFFPTAEGYYDYIKDQYIYQHKDHLGNVRLSYGRNSTGALEITDNNDYYPFGMNHFKTGTAFFRQGSYKNYKYSNKELQETGMYSYGWREYMPDLGRWNGIDQLAENYLSTSTYAYVANNPISLTDPDGRWIYEDGSIGQGPSPLSLLGPSHHAYMSFSMSDGISYNSGAGGGGGAYNFTGNDAASVFNYFKNGGNINGFSVNNGYARWWTDGDIMGYKKVINGETETGVRELVMHSAKIDKNAEFWDGATKRLGALGFANDVKIQLFEAGIRSNAGLSIRQFNALNKTAQELRTLGALGYSGSKYLSMFKNLGVAASVVTTTYSATKVYDQYQKGGAAEVFNHRDVVDTAVGVIGLGTTALVTLGLVSNPVGWAIGIGVLAYGTGTMIYDMTSEP